MGTPELRPRQDLSRRRVALLLACVLVGSGLLVLALRRGARPERVAAEPPAEPANVSRPAQVELAEPELLDEAEREPVPVPAQESAVAPAPATPARAEPSPAAPLLLRGRVLFPDGAGVPGASVRLGPFATRTDEHGGFELSLSDDRNIDGPRVLYSHSSPLDSLQRDTALVAWLQGWVPAVLAGFGARVVQGEPLDPVELVLPERASTIDGVVLDRTGGPAAGWRVSLLDGTPALADDFRPFSAEELASGTSAHVELGLQGAFAFEGLTPGQSYRVRAWNQRTLEQVTSAPIPAGTRGYVLRAPDEPWRPLVDGVVLGLDGTPLPDVTCRLTMVEYQREGGMWMTTGQEVVTDGRGRFEFADVPPVELFIRFNGYGSGDRLDLPPDEPCRDLRVELVRSGSFVLERTGSSPAADTLRIFDQREQRLRIEVDTGPGTTSGVRDLALSTSGEVRGRVSESARWLALYLGEREVARLPLLVRFGGEARVRW